MTTGRPTVILHNAVSLDGWLDGFEPDLGLFYETAGKLQAQAILSGSTTLLTGFADASDDDPGVPAPALDPDRRPVLIVVDSRGRIGFWDRVRRQPYWKSVIVLCSPATPRSALERIERAGLELIVCGSRKVDLARALEILRERHGFATVRVDSGGTLNAALVRANLVDEVSLLLHPVIVGPAGKLSLVHPRPAAGFLPVPLEAVAIEQLAGGVVWLRGTVRKESQ